jgi:hypothetical protein
MLALAGLMSCTAPCLAQSQIPAGTRFVVELEDKLDARKVQASQKFEAHTVEPLVANDGSSLPAGTKLRGEVVSLREDAMTLRFDSVDTPRGPQPLAATATRTLGDKTSGQDTTPEKNDKKSAEGAHKAPVAAGSRGRLNAVGGGVKWFLVGGPESGSPGAGNGARSANKTQVLEKGTRLEVQLDQPLEVSGH